MQVDLCELYRTTDSKAASSAELWDFVQDYEEVAIRAEVIFHHSPTRQFVL